MKAQALALASLLVALLAAPAGAEVVGLRPLGGDYEAGRTIGPGRWAVEAGAWLPQFEPPGENAPDKDWQVFERWTRLPAWPVARGLYGLSDGNEAVIQLGPVVGGGYRKHFLRADAPWGGEYLQALIQLGGGFHLASFMPMGYIRLPALYERGAWTFHVAPGGYYLFNQQPIVEVNLGVEVRPFEALHLGAHTRLRMDAKQMTPMEGTWALGGGARYQWSEHFTIQLEAQQDPGPPVGKGSVAAPPIELPFQGLTLSATYFY